MTSVEDIEAATPDELDEIAWKHRYNMSRDKLAAQAMQGLCGHHGVPVPEVAKLAYDIAEAMLAEGKKRRVGQ